MTALTTAPARGRLPLFPLPGPWRAVLRQHRTAAWIALALLVVGAAVLIGDYVWVSRAADEYRASGCSIEHTTAACGGTVRGYLDAELQLQHNLRYAGLAMLLLPCLVGAYAAGPLIGKDLESGTYKLAWSQSISPIRWLATRLALCAALVLVWTAALIAVHRWVWANEPNLGPTEPGRWYDRVVYGSVGPVALAYALLALAVGALVALVVRRVIPAMGLTVAVTGAAVALLPRLRAQLWATETSTTARLNPPRVPDDALPVARGMLTRDGGRLPEDVCFNRPIGGFKQCLAEHQVTGWYQEFHPSSHFWPLQLLESGIVLALAATAAYAAFRVLRRRTP